MSDDPLNKAHVIPDPPDFLVTKNTAPSFGRQFERLFPGEPCYYCGEAPNSVDHLIPRSKGGDDGTGNLVPCCFRCNQMKSDLTLQGFIARMELVLKTLLEKDSVKIGARKKVIQAGEVLQCPLAA